MGPFVLKVASTIEHRCVDRNALSWEEYEVRTTRFFLNNQVYKTLDLDIRFSCIFRARDGIFPSTVSPFWRNGENLALANRRGSFVRVSRTNGCKTGEYIYTRTRRKRCISRAEEANTRKPGNEGETSSCARDEHNPSGNRGGSIDLLNKTKKKVLVVTHTHTHAHTRARAQLAIESRINFFSNVLKFMFYIYLFSFFEMHALNVTQNAQCTLLSSSSHPSYVC